MIISYLLLLVEAVAMIYAIRHSTVLLNCLDLIEDCIQNGDIPNPDLLVQVEKVLSKLFYLVAAIVILLTLLQLANKTGHA